MSPDPESVAALVLTVSTQLFDCIVAADKSESVLVTGREADLCSTSVR